MVWHLQDMQKHIDAEEIEAPMLLPGISLTSEMEERKKNRRLYKPDDLADKFLNDNEEEGPGLDTRRAFEEHSKKAREIVFREREVDNLMNMIYSNADAKTDVDMTEDYDEEDEGVIDTNRFDVAQEKLAMYKQGPVKRKLKSKFVTGQSSD